MKQVETSFSVSISWLRAKLRTLAKNGYKQAEMISHKPAKISIASA